MGGILLKSNYVFTYGTLLKGERNHHLINDDDFVSEGSIKNYRMFNLGRYPGIETSFKSTFNSVLSLNSISAFVRCFFPFALITAIGCFSFATLSPSFSQQKKPYSAFSF